MRYDFYLYLMGLMVGLFIGIISESQGFGKYILIPSVIIYFYLKWGKIKIE